MTQVSRVPLRREIWERIFSLFIDTFVRIKERDKLERFIGNFFTPTERIMFAKRLAAGVMIAKGQNYLTIRRVLKLSPPTIAKMSFRVKYEGEGLNPVIEDILKDHAKQVVWEEIMSLFDMPTKGAGFGVWRKRKFERRSKIRSLKTEP